MSAGGEVTRYLGGRELERAVGISRFLAARLALRGDIAFVLGDNGAPRFSVADAMRVVTERTASSHSRLVTRSAPRAGAGKGMRRASGRRA